MRMIAMGVLAAVGLVGMAATKAGPFAPGNPIEAKARRDEAFVVAKDDPAILAARDKALATLDRFLAVNERRPPNSRAYALKVAVRDGDRVEWFWIRDFVREGSRFRGAIDNTPRVVRTVQNGQQIAFQRADIGDWMYLQDGRMMGNYTACALIAKEDRQAREQFERKFGLDCRA